MEKFQIFPHLDYYNSSQSLYAFRLLLHCWQMTWMTMLSAGESSRRACAHQFLTESPRAAAKWSEAHKQVHLKAVQTKSEGGCTIQSKSDLASLCFRALWRSLIKTVLRKKTKRQCSLHCVADLLPVFSLNSRHYSFLSEKMQPTQKKNSAVIK